MTMRDANLMNYMTNTSISKNLIDAQAKCKTANLDSLIENQSLTSDVRCGWIYQRGSSGEYPAVSTGFLGQKKGPERFFPEKPPGGRWYWNLDAAKKDIMKDRCAALTTCTNVGAENYKGCAYSTTLGSGVPVNAKGTMLYPGDPTASAPASSLILASAKCPPPPPPGSPAYQLQRSRDVCMPMEDGRLSRDCMLYQVTAAGCSQDGALYDSLVNEATPNNYAAGLQELGSFKKYQQLSRMPLLDNVVQTGATSTWIALNNFSQLKQQLDTPNNELNTAARDLCLQKGVMEDYDFCLDLKDTTPGPFPLECMQNAFIEAGGTTAGTKYPTKENKLEDTYNKAYPTWGKYLAFLRNAVSLTKSNDEKVQTPYLQRMLGILREGAAEDQIVPIQGNEVFWFNNATNAFIGRRLTLYGARLPWISTAGPVEGTDLANYVEYYSITNLRPPTTTEVQLSFGTDDGSVYALNKNIDGKKTRGQAFNDETMFGANWDQASTQYTSNKLWKLQGGGPNYFNGYWQQTGGFSLSALQVRTYKNGFWGGWGQLPSEWQTLTQEPNAPMLSWEGTKDYGFIERRFPSMMELVMTGGYSMVANPSPKLKYPSVLKLKASGNGGMGQVKRNIAPNSWRTLTMSFVVNSATTGHILSMGNRITIRQNGTSVDCIYSEARAVFSKTFQLNPDGVTPHYLTINLLSQKENRYPNQASFYVDTFGYTDYKVASYSTPNYEPLIDKAGSNNYEQLMIGAVARWGPAADISIGSIRLFDYELKADEYNKDQANTWQMKYIQDTN